MSPAMSSAWRKWVHQDGALVLSLLLLLLLLLQLVVSARRKSSRRRLPPSLPKLPLIGNLHQLGSYNHRSLTALSGTHGPLIFLQLGMVPTLVVSSAGMAEEIMKANGTALENRPELALAKELFGCKSMGFSPYGEYWKKLRRFSNLHILGPKRVGSYKALRQEEVAFMMDKIEQSSSCFAAVNLAETLRDFIINLVSRVIDGRSFRDDGLEKVFHELMEEHVPLISRFNVGDYFPFLWWVDSLTSFYPQVRRLSQKWDDLIDCMIKSRVNRSAENIGRPIHEETFMDVLLSLLKDPASAEFRFTMENIKAIIIELLTAGTETQAVVLEWAMAELFRYSEVMKRAQAEIRDMVGAKATVEEADTIHMNYLRAVIKETLRLHPSAGLLMPRLSKDTRNIGGYEIPKQTRIVINSWAIMRDPSYWDFPEEFRPERFLGESAPEFRGADFQFIPFGLGRRVCPGLQFALPVVELALSNLLHRFDWKLPDGMRGVDLNMDETLFRLPTCKKHNLLAVPKLHACSVHQR